MVGESYRADLLDHGVAIDGAGHGVNEAVHLRDPDGNGIEPTAAAARASGRATSGAPSSRSGSRSIRTAS